MNKNGIITLYKWKLTIYKCKYTT